jgi:inner membrane protein
MATCFSHPAVPLAIACWFPSLRKRPLLIAAALLSAAPDLDALGFLYFDVPYESPCGHRGCTHSLVFSLAVALALARPLARRTGTSALAVLAFLLAASASHGLIDMTTDGGHGIALFWPFTDERYFLPWRPIAVAPLGIAAFFSRWGLEVLWSEFCWMWLPALAIGGAGLLLRRRTGSPS